MANAFQHNAFQQTIGFVAFQQFIIGGSSGRTEEIDGRRWREGVTRFDVHAAAVHLGTKGGLIGGPARAEALTPKQLSRHAFNAAIARWK